METVVIVIHLMVIIALIALVLLQRSEGGALGIGGGGNFMSSRGQGNILTRSTAILAVAFFATSIILTVIARLQERPSSILDTVPTATAPVVPVAPGVPTVPTAPTAPGTGQGILNDLQGLSQPAAPPATTAPAPTTAPAAETPAAPVPAPAPAEPQVPAAQ